MLLFNNMNKGVKDARKIHIPNGVVFFILNFATSSSYSYLPVRKKQ